MNPGPKAKIEGGRTRAYYLGARHVAALEAYRVKFGHSSAASALRAILDVVAQSLGARVIPEAPKPPDEVDDAMTKAGW